MLKDRRIHVNAVSPGLTKTAGLNDLFGGGEHADATKDYLVVQIPAGRIGQPDEIAKAVLFLASDDASFINGIELFVDGGPAQMICASDAGSPVDQTPAGLAGTRCPT